MTRLLDRTKHAALGMPVALMSPACLGQMQPAPLLRVPGIDGNCANGKFAIAA